MSLPAAPRLLVVVRLLPLRPLRLLLVETSESAHQRSRMPMRGRASSLSPAPSCTIAAANRSTKARFSPLWHKPLADSSFLILHTPHVGSRSTAAVAAGSLALFPNLTSALCSMVSSAVGSSPLSLGSPLLGAIPSALSLSSITSNACAVVSRGAATCAVGPFVSAALAALTPPSPWFNTHREQTHLETSFHRKRPPSNS